MTAVFHTLEQKIQRLREQIIRLEQIKNKIKSPDDLKNDSTSEAVVERLLQIALEAVLDIGRMIISMENLPRPQDNDTIFQVLGNAKILTSDYAKKAKGLGGFRNILVHGYMIIEVDKVYANLQKLDQLKEYLQFISKYLASKTKNKL